VRLSTLGFSTFAQASLFAKAGSREPRAESHVAAAAAAAGSFGGIQYTSTWMSSRSNPRRSRISLAF
jgi:hypothetical protein